MQVNERDGAVNEVAGGKKQASRETDGTTTEQARGGRENMGVDERERDAWDARTWHWPASTSSDKDSHIHSSTLRSNAQRACPHAAPLLNCQLVTTLRFNSLSVEVQ